MLSDKVINELSVGCWVRYSFWSECKIKEIHMETGTCGPYILLEDDLGNTKSVSIRLFKKYASV